MNKQNDIQLSEHFKLSEFTKSITAERLGISNKPDYRQRLALQHLCREVLQGRCAVTTDSPSASPVASAQKR